MDVYFIGGGIVDGVTVTVNGIIKDKQMENSRIRLVLDVWMENEEGQKVIVGSASGLVSWTSQSFCLVAVSLGANMWYFIVEET